ncbi:MAG: YwiC-like family protein [Omnitrophica WOR_2 bacterium]
MEASLSIPSVFRKTIALPQDHGSWVFILSPLLIGLFAGRNWSIASIYLVLAALSAFLIRQPVTILVKVYSKRRPSRELPAAIFWTALYAFIGLLAIAGLLIQGDLFVIYLAIPGIPVFALHLVLVSRRSERRQIGVELIAAGVLALAAPAGYWVSLGNPSTTGWLLWLLTWFQSAASIVYAYLRLEQRQLKTIPDLGQRVGMGRRALLYTSFNLAGVSLLAWMHIVPALLSIPYAVQWLETLWGTLRPAVRQRPTAIGIRQLVVSALFTILFILTWG